MKSFRVIVTDDAKEDLRRYKNYLLQVKKSSQAARSVVLDFRETRKRLMQIADSLSDPESEVLIERALRRINFIRHDYFLLYKIEDGKVFITNMFHASEDFEKKLK